MAISCPNCGIPCTGCAGAKITTASNGVKCCTKCVARLEQQIQANKQAQENQQPKQWVVQSHQTQTHLLK